MATVDETSTQADLDAGYFANCGYEEDDDAAMAARFVTVCRAMLRRAVSQLKQGDDEMRFAVETLRDEITEARRFIAGKAGGCAGVVHFGGEYFRD